jgi:type III restriction enzyme
VEEKLLIRGMLFGGFAKCLYPAQKFDSDPERRFAIILEDETSVLKWLKPSKDVLKIYYHQEEVYQPDLWLKPKALDTSANRSEQAK